MAARNPVISEAHFKTMLAAFYVANYDPRTDKTMMSALRRATKNDDYEIGVMYDNISAQIEQAGSPFGALPQIIS